MDMKKTRSSTRNGVDLLHIPSWNFAKLANSVWLDRRWKNSKPVSCNVRPFLEFHHLAAVTPTPENTHLDGLNQTKVRLCIPILAGDYHLESSFETFRHATHITTIKSFSLQITLPFAFLRLPSSSPRKMIRVSHLFLSSNNSIPNEISLDLDDSPYWCPQTLRILLEDKIAPSQHANSSIYHYSNHSIQYTPIKSDPSTHPTLLLVPILSSPLPFLSQTSQPQLNTPGEKCPTYVPPIEIFSSHTSHTRSLQKSTIQIFPPPKNLPLVLYSW